MRENGLALRYSNGINTVLGRRESGYPVGDLLCRIYQGETLYNISQIVRNCIGACPMRDNELTQDEVEQAEDYILQTLMYDDFYPAQRLAQGSFIRCMENYRALDSKTAGWLLWQEKQRIAEDDRLFKDIGFGTVGEFLRLCFNNYLIDLINGIDLFRVTSAVWAGDASEEEAAHYVEMCSALHNESVIPATQMLTSYDTGTGSFQYTYVINSFLSMAVFEFSHLAETATKIVRCQNPECRKFFTAKRNTAKYCGNPAPQCPGRSCNDYYPQMLYRDKVRSDDLDRLIKNAKCRLYNTRRRHPETAADVAGLLDSLMMNADAKKQEVLGGTLTKPEFSAWLNSHRLEKGDLFHE